MSFRTSKQKIRNFLHSCTMHGLVFCFLLTQSYGQIAFANPNQSVFYVIKKGDTLSQILQSLGLRPIYGKGGSLSRFLSCRELKDNGDLIRTGETVHFLFAADPITQDHVQIRPSGEIVIARDRVKSDDEVERQRKVASHISNSHIAPNFKNLCPEPSSKTIENAVIQKNQTDYPAERNPQSADVQSPTTHPISPSVETNSRSFFLVEADSIMTRQDLRTNAGGYSELLSKASPGLRIQWREEVSSNWDLDLSYSQFSSSLTVPQGSTLNGDLNFTEFSVAGMWNSNQSTATETSRWSVGPTLKYRTELITARLNGSSIRAESPQLMLIGASLENERDLGLQKKSLRLKTNLSVWYVPRASQNDFVISNGYGLSADIRLLRPIGRQLDLSGGISYGLSNLKSSLGEHAGQQVIFGLGLVYRFGDFQFSKAVAPPTQISEETGGSK